MTRELGRRDALRAGGLAALASVAGCAGLSDVLGGGGGDGNWTTYQGGPAHTGANQAAAGPDEDLSQRWERSVDEFTDIDGAAITRLSPPAVVDDTAYLTLTGRTEDGPLGVHLLALDVADGSVDWRTAILEDYAQTAGPQLPPPTVVDGTVVVSMVSYATPMSAVGVDVDSGDVTWESPGEHIPSTCATPMDGSYVFGSETAHALDGEGAVDWTFGEDERPALASTNEPPTVGNGTAYVAARTTLYALDSSGERQWARELAQENEFELQSTVSAPAVDGDVYVATGSLERNSDGRLLALSPDDGSTKWEFTPEFDREAREQAIRDFFDEHGSLPQFPSAGIYTTPTVWNGTLYALGMRPDPEDMITPEPRLYAIDAGDGSKVWDRPLPDYFGSVPPVVADGSLYVGINGGVVRVDLDERTVAEPEQAGEGYVNGLAIADDALYLGRANSIAAFGP